VSVDCAALLKIVKAIDDPVLDIAKGRKLKVSAKDSDVWYTIQPIPASKNATLPPEPVDGWRVLTLAEMTALTALASAVDPHVKGNTGLMGIHLTPEWAIMATNTMVAAAWVPGLTTESVLASPVPFKGLVGTGAIRVDDNTCWVSEDGTGQIRWCRLLAYDFPAASFGTMITAARANAASQTQAVVDGEALYRLAKQAQAVIENRAQVARLTVTDRINLNIDGGSAYGDRTFSGTVACDVTGSETMIGMNPAKMATGCRVLAASEGAKTISVGGPLDPLYMVNVGEVAVEVLMMPQRLPTQ